MNFENSVSLFCSSTMICFFKKTLSSTLIISVLSSTVLLAQGNIILKNGAELPAKVLEVSASQIKYKRQDNPSGPVYSYTIKDVLLIKYANGSKDVFGNSVSMLSPVGLDTTHGLNRLANDQIFL